MSIGFTDVLSIVRNPSLFRGEIRKYGVRINKLYQKKFYDFEATDIIEEDWDNLIILDGCRYDAFKKVNNLPGSLESRVSVGSSSWEFIDKNFQGRNLTDTVYITANPHLYRMSSHPFHAVVDLMSEWDDELQTVLPSDVITAAGTAVKKFPNKRYIIHFMQPHYPFIGDIGKNLDHRGFRQNLSEQQTERPNIWEELQWGKNNSLSEDDVWNAYIENLEIVLDHCEKLFPKIDGLTVITADHGNLIGDKMHPVPVKGYGHPSGLRSSELIQVPWHVVNNGERKLVTSDPPIETDSWDETEVVDQLAALGYR